MECNTNFDLSVAPGLAISLSASHLGFHPHAGFLEEISKLFRASPQFLAGSSSGAFVAGLFAAGMSPQQIHQALLLPSMRRSFWEWHGPLRGLAMLAGCRGFTGMLSGWRLRRLLRTFIGDTQIEMIDRVELSIAATDIARRERFLFRSGSLADAITTSCGVPILFQAVRHGEALLWDGAVADSSPIDHLTDDPRVKVIVVHVVSTPLKKQPLTISQALGEAHETISKRLLEAGVERAQMKGKQILVVETSVPKQPFLSRRGAAALFKAGAASVSLHTNELKNALDVII